MSPGTPPEGGPRPGVYARLRVEAQRSTEPLRPGRWVRWAGWVIIAGVAAGVAATALRVHPW
ncbi:MAG: hypothetical protein U0Y82_01035 [Thermoleophilia bacterium]